MKPASQMTFEEISDSMIAGIRKLRDDGKNLGNGWDVSELSFPGIEGGGYHPAYTHGGPETLSDTVMRMCRVGQSAVSLSVLQKIISAMKMTLSRSEFAEDPSLFLSKEWLESDLESFIKRASELESGHK